MSYEDILNLKGYKLNGTSNDITTMNKIFKIDKNYTWHHLNDDCMVRVPKEIHGVISHVGGVSGCRKGELP